MTIETSPLSSPCVTFEMLELWCKINIFSLIIIWEGLFIAVFTVQEVVCNFHVFSLVSKACEQNMMEWGWNGNKLVVDFTAWPSHYFHWSKVAVKAWKVNYSCRYYKMYHASGMDTKMIAETFRFWDNNDYEYKIFSIPSIAHRWTSVILAGKHDSPCHSTRV